METSRIGTTDRIGRSTFIRNLTGAILVGVTLTVSSGQLFAAETDPCARFSAVSNGDPQNGVPSIFAVNVSPVQEHRDAVFAQATEPAPSYWTFEHGRPISAQEAEARCASDPTLWVDTAAEAQGWPNFDSTNIAIRQDSSVTGSETNATVAEPEDTVIPEWVAAASGIRLEENDAQGAVTSTSATGYYVIVDENGNAFSPEHAAAGSTTQTASAGPANTASICFTCAAFA